MPARVVREELLTSDSLARVSHSARLTFVSLILTVDDWGRIDGRAQVLKSRLFPLDEKATPKQVERWIGELISVGCVRAYGHNDRTYLHLPGWETYRGKTRRYGESKLPRPPEAGGNTRSPGTPGIPQNSPSGVGVGVGEGDRGFPGETRGRVEKPTGFPAEGSPERTQLGDRLRQWQPKHRRVLSPDEIDYVLESVADWHAGKPGTGRGGRDRADWYAACREGVRKGWALEGFDPQHAAAKRTQAEAIEALRDYDPDAFPSLDEQLRAAGEIE